MKKDNKGPRHPFRFRFTDEYGGRVITAWAEVRDGVSKIALMLTDDHVAKSMKLGGVGNTMTCSMAICAKEHASAFPHPVCGHIDWTNTRCFVVSKLDDNGLPSECYVYEHNGRIATTTNGRINIAVLNDSVGGQKKLRKYIQTHGPIGVTLYPKRKRSTLGRPGAGRTVTGKRKPITAGSKLRYATALAGGFPNVKLKAPKRRTTVELEVT